MRSCETYKITGTFQIGIIFYNTAATIRMAMAAMADPKAIALEVANRLGITTATLYAYVNSDGSLKENGTKILGLP